MKKLLFSAMACISFAGSAFASNEVIIENDVTIMTEQLDSKKPCLITATVTKDGQSMTKYAHGSGDVSLADCEGVMNAFIQDLKNEGYVFSEKDITLIWGNDR